MCGECAGRFLTTDAGGELITRYRPIFSQQIPGLILGYMEIAGK